MGETTFKTLCNWRWLYSMNFTQTSLRRRDEDYILWCFKIISVKYIPPFVTVIRCYKNGRHQDCDTTENESRTRDLYLYLFYTKYGKKSCIFRGQAGFFLTALMTHTIGFNSTLNLRKISNFQVLSIFLLDNFRGLTATR